MSKPAPKADESESLDLFELYTLLRTSDSDSGTKAFQSLCDAGCDKNILAFHVMNVRRAHQGIVVIQRDDPAKPPIVINYSEDDSWMSALGGLTPKDLDAVASRAKKLHRDLLRLQKTALVRKLLTEGIIPRTDLLARSAFFSSKTTPDPRFDGLLRLPGYARQCGPKRKPSLNRRLSQLVEYVEKAIQAPHHKFLSDILSCAILDIDFNESMLKVRIARYRRRLKKPSVHPSK